ncbi:MAG: NAD(P)-dependent oxidoreductase [Candidatus Woesearchaeota archaeon]
MAKIAFFDVHDWEKPYLKKQLAKHQCLFFNESLTSKHISKIKDVDALSLFVHSHVENSLLEKLPNVKIIALRATGFDNVDLQYCAKRGIAVCNVPFYGANTVAEYTFALLLAISRKMTQTIINSAKQDYTQVTGFDLQGKTIGIIGGGHIGQHAIRIAKGFGMNVLVYDVIQNEFNATTLGYTYVSLPQLLKQSDVISLHAPYNKYTHHIINKKNISSVKKGAVLLNTSRGGLVDSDALLSALNKGRISFAGLDVLEDENSLLKGENVSASVKARNKKLATHKRVLFTPHNAFNTQEALVRILDVSVENLQKGLAGKIQNKVN